MIIIGLIWGLQVFFVSYFFEQMKINETTNIATQAIDSFKRENYDLNALASTLETITIANSDVYMRVETLSGDILLAPDYDGSGPLYKYNANVDILRKKLISSNMDRVSYVSTSASDRRTIEGKVLSYACYINNGPNDVVSFPDDFGDTPNTGWAGERYVLYIFTPLHLDQSTLSILRLQLFYISIIAIGLAFILALYFSKKISKPIRAITESAAEMGKGNYGVQFCGGSYTEITDLADTLTKASRELEKTDMYQKDLIANVSHDLRTPLTMIKSYAEMIRDLSGNNPVKRESHLAVIIDEADRLNALVTDMLNLSRMQNRIITIEKEVFDVKVAAESLVASYDILKEQDGYIVKLNCPESIYIDGDNSKLKQVVTNLINNAIKFCGDDKLVEVNIKRINKKMRCEVTDHGVGIPEDEIDHVWERYYKSSTNHVRSIEGTGLGLSIVKEILSLHKAEYGVISKPGKGSTFWFEIETVKNNRNK